MAKKHAEGYLSAKESRRISKENRKITNQYEKQHKRKNVSESEYLTEMKDPKNVLEIEDLKTYFFSDAGTVKAVDGISFNVPIGKTVGVVGESGCGKSVTSLSIMQLLQRPQGQVVGGEIRLNLGEKAYDINKMPTESMQRLRGNYLSMIFQEPMTSLNPVFRIGAQVDEVIELHSEKKLSKADIKQRTIELLEMVGIANSEGVYRMYPHELSGGMRQRVMIAMALACSSLYWAAFSLIKAAALSDPEISSAYMIFTAGAASITPIFAFFHAYTMSEPMDLLFMVRPAVPFALPTTTVTFGTSAFANA